MSDATARIEELKSKINEIEGRPTEVYSRIVGYYRSVKNWNNGKSAEYKIRKTFMEPEGEKESAPVEKKEVIAAATAAETVTEPTPALEAVINEVVGSNDQADLFSQEVTIEEVTTPSSSIRYSFFYRNTCPNCPPVKELVDSLEWQGAHINVDEEEGLNTAVEHKVYTAPTVILFDQGDKELFRSSDAKEIREYIAAEGKTLTAV